MMNRKRIFIALLVFLVLGGTLQAQADVSVWVSMRESLQNKGNAS